MKDQCFISIAGRRLIDLATADGRGVATGRSLAELRHSFPDVQLMEVKEAMALLDNQYATALVACKAEEFAAVKHNARVMQNVGDNEAVLGGHVYGAIKLIYLRIGQTFCKFQGRWDEIAAKMGQPAPSAAH